MKYIISLFTFLLSSQLTAYEYIPTNKNAYIPIPFDEHISNMLLKNTIGLRYGVPSEGQIVPIETKEFYYQRRLPAFNETLLTPLIELSISQLNVDEKQGYILGVGPAFHIPLGGTEGRVDFTAQAKVQYLTKDDFGRKRYGGPIHWNYGFGLKTKITVNTFASYIWQHMSNANAYQYNPTLETHTFSLGIHF